MPDPAPARSVADRAGEPTDRASVPWRTLPAMAGTFAASVPSQYPMSSTREPMAFPNTLRDQQTAGAADDRTSSAHRWGFPGEGTEQLMASPARRPSAAHTRVSIITGAIGGLALVASTFLAWPASGAGSGLAAHRLADVLMSEAVDPWMPRWWGLAVYVVPAAGAVVMLTSGLEVGIAPVLKAVALVVAAIVTIATVVALPTRHTLDLGPGALVALAGLGFGLLSVLADRHRAGPRAS
jgi:hypothetical protein